MRKQLLTLLTFVLASTLTVGAVAPQTPSVPITKLGKSGQLILPETPFATKSASKAGTIDVGGTIAADPTISTAPAGQTVTYSRSAYTIYYTTAGTKMENTYGNLTEVVFAENGSDVYIKNPLLKWSTNTYIKGTLKDGIISFDLPQAVQAYGSDYIYVSLENISEDGENGTKTDNQTLQYSYENGIITQLTDAYVSLTDNSGSKWYGYGEINQVMTPFEDNSLTGLNLQGEEYNFIYDGRDGHKVTVAQDGNDIYIKGMFANLPESWIKGTTEGSKYVFKPQAIGVIDNSAAYFMPAKISYEYVYYEQYDFTDSVAVFDKIDQFELEYDAVRDLYITDEDVVILANTSIDTPATTPLSLYTLPAFRKQGDVSNSVPAPPAFYGFYNYFSYWGEYDFDFYLSMLSTDGDILDQDKLYYNILLDDVPMTFYGSDYGLKEDIEDVPYALSAGQSILIFDLERVIAIFSDGFDKVGVQIIYKPSEGKAYRSAILEYDLSTRQHAIKPYVNNTSVANTLSDKQIQSVESYDLMGRRISNPQSGLYIQRINYTDGSSKTVKSVIK